MDGQYYLMIITFNDMVADMLSNKKLTPIVTELFTRGRKLNISDFNYTILFCFPKNIRLNSKHYVVLKIPKKRDLPEMAFNHSSDIDFTDCLNLYKKCIKKLYSFLVTDTTLASDNPLCFRKCLLETK